MAGTGASPKPALLTAERVPLEGGGTAVAYAWRGSEVLVRDDAAGAVRAVAALSGGGDRDAAGAAFLQELLPDLAQALAACGGDPAELASLAVDAAWDVLGVDLAGDKGGGAPLWDLEQDAAAIRVSLRQAYGFDWDADGAGTSFAEFCALVASCPPSTPIGRAIYYRNPATRPRPSGRNSREIDEWNRLHRAYALDGPRTSARPDGAMSDAFAALRNAAR